MMHFIFGYLLRLGMFGNLRSTLIISMILQKVGRGCFIIIGLCLISN